MSHHHHHGLFVAMNLKRVGTEKSRYSKEEVVEAAEDFWNSGGNQHFREEEEILLPALSQYASIDTEDIKEMQEMLIEHVLYFREY
ncbi:hypothetical protein ACE1TI_09765 [Alteribacillus sp. JSM 102045]|uniref:hypothetical protein n=1 Tax=Alteribacillus sp. JSM 102045 TaxID=1562101 RepID=UPI0035C1F643